MLVSEENGDLVAAGLRQASLLPPWQEAVLMFGRSEFGDAPSTPPSSRVPSLWPLEKGEAEVSHSLCGVHSQRTLDRRFSPSKKSFRGLRRHTMAALYNRETRPGRWVLLLRQHQPMWTRNTWRRSGCAVAMGKLCPFSWHHALKLGQATLNPEMVSCTSSLQADRAAGIRPHS